MRQMLTHQQVDLKQTALYFGTTYDTLENRFRKIKKESEILKKEVASGERSEISTPSRSTPKKTSPKKDALASKRCLQHCSRRSLISLRCHERPCDQVNSEEEIEYQAGVIRRFDHRRFLVQQWQLQLGTWH